MSWAYSTGTHVMTELQLDYPHDVFRKVWDTHCAYDLNEYDICLILKNNPHKNIVHIYDVQRGHVDEEMLDVGLEKEDFLKAGKFEEISLALEHLHKLNIVYIDLKLENIGWSKRDSCYKLFDFNASGIIEEGGKFRRPVLPGFVYQKINSNVKCLDDLIEYDFYAQYIFRWELEEHE